VRKLRGRNTQNCANYAAELVLETSPFLNMVPPPLTTRHEPWDQHLRKNDRGEGTRLLERIDNKSWRESRRTRCSVARRLYFDPMLPSQTCI